MITLQSFARPTASRVGRESTIIRTIRPVYQKLVNGLNGGKGIRWNIKSETDRVDARHRNCFPPFYEPAPSAILKKRVKAGVVCLDVGANVSIHLKGNSSGCLGIRRNDARTGQASLANFEPESGPLAGQTDPFFDYGDVELVHVL